jgi:dUTP pyrophosphatase
MKKLRIVNTSNNELPTYATKGSAGMDLRANLQEDVVIAPGERKLISTGLKISLPDGYEAQIRPRSGLALKKGVTVLNSPGTVDSDYIGDIGVILINHGEESFTVSNGDRIAQMVIAKHETVEFEQVESLDETERGSGGFGSTGKA